MPINDVDESMDDFDVERRKVIKIFYSLIKRPRIELCNKLERQN